MRANSLHNRANRLALLIFTLHRVRLKRQPQVRGILLRSDGQHCLCGSGFFPASTFRTLQLKPIHTITKLNDELVQPLQYFTICSILRRSIVSFNTADALSTHAATTSTFFVIIGVRIAFCAFPISFQFCLSRLGAPDSLLPVFRLFRNLSGFSSCGHSITVPRQMNQRRLEKRAFACVSTAASAVSESIVKLFV